MWSRSFGLSWALREPLVHFLLIGAVIFAAYGLVAPPQPAADRERIVVTTGDVTRLSSLWEKRWRRPPTQAELDGLVAEHIREEVLYREALALGLDRDDAAIRRLLRQKYEFVTQDLAVAAEPHTAELATWYEANRERYRKTPRLSFTQVQFNLDPRGPDSEGEAALALASLRGGKALPEELGHGQLLDTAYRELSGQEVAAIFGPDFAEAVSRLETGVWSGPIRSGYGIHLVRLDALTPASDRPFEEVEERVRADWAYEKRQEANEAILRRLLDRYDVVVERPVEPARPTTGRGQP
jgi:peptidyl-prolyl cis-trans isomerase C